MTIRRSLLSRNRKSWDPGSNILKVGLRICNNPTRTTMQFWKKKKGRGFLDHKSGIYENVIGLYIGRLVFSRRSKNAWGSPESSATDTGFSSVSPPHLSYLTDFSHRNQPAFLLMRFLARPCAWVETSSMQIARDSSTQIPWSGQCFYLATVYRWELTNINSQIH